MAIEVSVSHKVHPKDTLIELSGVCAVPNGGSIVLNENEESQFKAKFPEGLPKKGIFSSKHVAAPAAEADKTKEGGE